MMIISKARLLAFSFAAFVSLAPLSNGYAQSTWTIEGPLATPRFDLTATAGADGTIFAVGGQTDSEFLTSVEVYRPSSRRWVPGPSLPTPKSGHAAALGGDGRIYVFGGWDGTLPFQFTVYALKPGMGAAWSSVAPLPTPRQWLGAATGTDGKIYTMGGVNENGEILDVVEIYDPATNAWSTGAPMPVARHSMGVARGGDGRIYAIGGLDMSHSGLRLVQAYSPATNSWTTVAPLPTRRATLKATATSDGLIYAISGIAVRPGGSAFFTKRVDVYSPSENRWWTLQQTQQVHSRAAAVTGRHRVFAVGGLLGTEGLAGVESRPSFCAPCQ